MWVEYNPNPRGKRVGDCVIRALCKAMEQDWNRTFLDVVIESCHLYDMPSANNVWGNYLKNRGFRRYILPDTCPECYTVEHFAEEHPEGMYVLATGSHVVCVVDGNWYDTWDSGNEIPTYYWQKEERK